MYKLLSKLVVYRNIKSDSILFRLADIYRDFDCDKYDKETLVNRIYTEIHRLLDISTLYGFDSNLWHNYIAFLLADTENPFSLCSEKVGASKGSVNEFAISDFDIFLALFNYNFSNIENTLGIDCFSRITNYHSIPKTKGRYNKDVSLCVRELSENIERADTAEEVFSVVTGFYRNYGVGLFGMNKAFRLKSNAVGAELEPITNTEEVLLTDIVGYDLQKQELTANTEAFVHGCRANNVLLYGDAGTGKSTSIKAILNEYYSDGLRIIEIYKHQFRYLPDIIARIKNRNYSFIIYMDDLSFEEDETEYKYLKAVIEGGLEIRPRNVLIYATSNRWHLIKETWSDRSDVSVKNDVRHSDSIEEKMSLFDRFGVTINYSKPGQNDYLEIVRELAARVPQIKLEKAELESKAKQWAMSHGGRCGRTAQQFIDMLSGQFGRD